jgi:hypothetical protein
MKTCEVYVNHSLNPCGKRATSKLGVDEHPAIPICEDCYAVIHGDVEGCITFRFPNAEPITFSGLVVTGPPDGESLN